MDDVAQLAADDRVVAIVTGDRVAEVASLLVAGEVFAAEEPAPRPLVDVAAERVATAANHSGLRAELAQKTGGFADARRLEEVELLHVVSPPLRRLLQGGGKPRTGDRKLVEPHADRVVDGVGDGRPRRTHRR